MAEFELPDWIADHMRRYLESNGEDGHVWQGVTCLLLTTTGSVSGEPRMLPLIYGKVDEGYVLVASKGGAPDHPSWYKNLVAEPSVEIQVGPDKMSGQAVTVSGAERERLWDVMVGIWPAYEEYQANTNREIPVVLVKPA